MAEQYNENKISKSHDEYEAKLESGNHGHQSGAETQQGRGLFNLLGKKEEEKPRVQEQVIVAEFDDKVEVSEEADHHLHHRQTNDYVDVKADEEKKHESLLDKFHRSKSSSSSSGDEEEVGEGEDTKKKKKRKEKKENIVGPKETSYKEGFVDTSVPVEIIKSDEEPAAGEAETRKGLLDKIKDKLPGHGQNKKTEEVVTAPPPAYEAEFADYHEGEAKDQKKGIIDKIKEKLPGYNNSSKTQEADKEKDHKDSVSQY